MNNMEHAHEETLCLLWDREIFLSTAMCSMSMSSMHGAWMVSVDIGNKEWAESFAMLRDVSTYIYLNWDFTDQKWMP